MADWDKINSRGNVEDRRGLGPVALGGGIGATGLVAYLLLSVLTGNRIDVGQVLGQLQTIQPQSVETQNAGAFAGADDYEVFASTVLGSSNDMWRGVFAKENKQYLSPKLVLFRTATDSGCGGATSDVGPHYCPVDKTIYLDETFFDELQSRFHAKGGDVAEAYVIAHEVGHHVQNQLGVLDGAINYDTRRATNQRSILTELQADCYAGMWANSIKSQAVLEPNEIREALDAASAVGDDRIQETINGYVSPETWTHGSSAQRVA